jgi:hypothetical protein
MPSPTLYLLTVFVACWVASSGVAFVMCGLFICHMATVVGDGLVAIGLGTAAVIASGLVVGTIGRGRRK